MFQHTITPYPHRCAEPQEGDEHDEGDKHQRLINYFLNHCLALLLRNGALSLVPSTWLATVSARSEFADGAKIDFKLLFIVNLVPETGIEPVRPFSREILSLLCLPISPFGL